MRPASPARWLALTVALAAAARLGLHASTSAVPGINGAYYLVQARALLERGQLGIPDLPLTFHLHAGVAWLLAQLAGLEPDRAILIAVKLTDSLLPPLAAIGVYLIVRDWAKARHQPHTVPLLAAAAACLAVPALRMLGDFQKNSLALVWLAFLLAGIHQLLRKPGLRRAGAWATLLPMLALTHIGVLGAAVVLLGAIGTAYLVINPRSRAPLIIAAVASVAIAAPLGVVFLHFDPDRVQRLLLVFAESVPDGPGALIRRLLPTLGFAVVLLPGAAIAWRSRHQRPASEVVFVTGSAAAVLLFTGPWFSSDLQGRLALIALIPAIPVGAYAILHLHAPPLRNAALVITTIAVAAPSLLSLPRIAQPTLSPDALAELAALAPHIEHPDHTLIATQHGVEWWTAWTLRTRIAQPAALRTADWQTYDAVFYLEVKAGSQTGGPHRNARGRGPGSGTKPRPAEPAQMQAVVIPDDATVVHDGPTLRLARVRSAPLGTPAQ